MAARMVLHDPLIEQSVAGPGIESDDRLRIIGRQVGDIGDSTDIDDGPVVLS